MTFLGADTSADRRKAAILVDDVGGSGDVALSQFIDKPGYINMHRASALTFGNLTVKATGCLQHCLLLIITEANFFKIGCAAYGILFAHRGAGYSISHSLLT